jgi:hypothetical protein
LEEGHRIERDLSGMVKTTSLIIPLRRMGWAAARRGLECILPATSGSNP